MRTWKKHKASWSFFQCALFLVYMIVGCGASYFQRKFTSPATKLPRQLIKPHRGLVRLSYRRRNKYSDTWYRKTLFDVSKKCELVSTPRTRVFNIGKSFWFVIAPMIPILSQPWIRAYGGVVVRVSKGVWIFIPSTVLLLCSRVSCISCLHILIFPYVRILWLSSFHRLILSYSHSCTLYHFRCPYCPSCFEHRWNAFDWISKAEKEMVAFNCTQFKTEVES